MATASIPLMMDIEVRLYKITFLKKLLENETSTYVNKK